LVSLLCCGRRVRGEGKERERERKKEKERVPILSPHAVSSPSVDITIRIEDGDDAPFQLINKTSDYCILFYC